MADTAGAASPRLKRLRRLSRQAKERASAGRFVIEGPTLIEEAISSGVELEELWVGHDVATEWDRVVRAAEAAGASVIFCGDEPLRSALDTRSSRPLAAVAVPSWDQRPLPEVGPVMAIVECGDPGNVGTLIRTSEAAGFAGVALVGPTVDPANSKVVRASAGAIFRSTIVRYDTVEELAAAMAPRPLLATVVTNGDPYDQADLSNAVILLGNEAHGLDDDQTAVADGRVTIELDGPTESLNVAAAGAVLAFESLRQRRGQRRRRR